jgi:formamidopyrimidine-DNA glycosylase
MPELPEVEIAKQQLIKWTTGREIKKIFCDDTMLKKIKNVNLINELQGEIVTEIHRFGKRCAIQTKLGFIIIHLGMTGKLTIQDRKYTRAYIEFSDRIIYLVDTRRFASIDINTEFISTGRDPLVHEISSHWLQKELKGKSIKNALLRQDILCGIGNIQASEALFRARISPDEKNISIEQAETLIHAIHESIQHTITASTPEGDQEIQYLHEGAASPFLVYGRSGLPCFVCSQAIEKKRNLGRSTFFCRKCQSVE